MLLFTKVSLRFLVKYPHEVGKLGMFYGQKTISWTGFIKLTKDETTVRQSTGRLFFFGGVAQLACNVLNYIG